MHILHVVPSLALSTGGPATNVVGLSRALLREGHEVAIFTTDLATSPQGGQLRGGISVDELPAGSNEIDAKFYQMRFPFRLVFSPSLWRSLRADAASYDVLHIHTLFLFPQYAAFTSARSADRPHIVSPRGALDPFLRQRGRIRKKATDILWQRKMLDTAAALHLTTEEERDLVVPLGIKSPHVVVPNGIDLQRFRAPGNGQAFRQQWLPDGEGPIILNHGRLNFKKGLDILVRAIAQLPEPYNRSRLVLVGPDDEGLGAELKQLANTLGVGPRLILVPALAGQDLLDALAAADVWVLPSHSENFGMAVAEAMAAGRPVITSPQVNIAPKAAAGDALVMVPNTPNAVAEAIVALLSDPARQSELGDRARSYVQPYDWSVVVDQYIAMYEQAIEYHRQQT